MGYIKNKLSNFLDDIPYSLGYVLFVIVVVNLSVHVNRWNDWQEVLWYCNFGAIVLSIGLVFRLRMLVNSVLISSIPVQAVWIIDFFLSIFDSGFGRTAWLFESAGIFVFMLSTIFHGVLIPLSFWGSVKLGYSKRAYVFSLVIFSIMMFSTFFFTDFVQNRNCVFYPCDVIYYKDPGVVLGGLEYNTWRYFQNELLTWYAVFFASYLFWRWYFKKRGVLL